MPRQSEDHAFKYDGFPSSNGTVVPDDLFDVLMPELSEAELRVLLYIIRRTFGFKKNSDAISLSQMVDGVATRDGRVLDRGTGMSRRGVMKGCAGLVEKGVIRVEKRLSEQGDNEINIYHLRFQGDHRVSEAGDATGRVGNNVPHRRAPSAPPVGNNVPPQQTDLQQTENHLSNIRNASNEKKSVERQKSGSREMRSDADNQSRPAVSSTMSAIFSSDPSSIDQPRQASWPTAIGETLGKRRPAAVEVSEDRHVLTDYLADFARELNDEAALRVSVTRALNLLKRSDLPRERFIELMFEARARTKEASASIRKTVKNEGNSFPVKNKMPFFFATLEQLCGVSADPSAQSSRSGGIS